MNKNPADNLKFRQKPKNSRPIIFKQRVLSEDLPTSDDIKRATEQYMQKGGQINIVDYYGRNPELVDEDTFVSTDQELNQIIEEAKI